ncbi:hypothetical protein [Streptomyces sp. NPDC094149]
MNPARRGRTRRPLATLALAITVLVRFDPDGGPAIGAVATAAVPVA